MTTATKAPAPTRLEKARTALEKARAALDAVKARQLSDGDVTAQELSDATHAFELAELAVTGAEEAEQRAAARARLDQLGRLRDEILLRADPAPVTEAAARIVADVALIVAALGPARNRRIAAQLNALRAANVPETPRNHSPAAEDLSLGWQSGGLTNSAASIRIGERTVATQDVAKLITALISLGTRAAEEHPAVTDSSGAPAAITADYAKYIERIM